MEALDALVKAELARHTGSRVGDPKGGQGAGEAYKVRGVDRGDQLALNRNITRIS